MWFNKKNPVKMACKLLKKNASNDGNIIVVYQDKKDYNFVMQYIHQIDPKYRDFDEEKAMFNETEDLLDETFDKVLDEIAEAGRN